MMMKILRPLLLLPLVLALNACYLPNKFELTMQIAPDGRYAMAYEGTLTQLQFLQRIGSGELQGDEIDDYVNIYEQNLRRNNGYKEVTYKGNAEYQVNYSKQGSIAKDKQFSFPSRQGIILGLRRWTSDSARGYLETFRATGDPALPAMAQAGFLQEPYIIELFGERLPMRVLRDLKQNGFWIQGTVRLWTSAKVGYSNADSVIPGNPALYIWEIDDFEDSPPHMILAWTPPES